MKFKTLRKKSSKEFVHIEMNSSFMCLLGVYTTEIPRLQPITATMEKLKELYAGYDMQGWSFDDFELVVLDIIDGDAIGADIRNKLTPLKNLISMLRVLKTRKMDKDKRKRLKELVQKEMEQGDTCIDYLTNLL
ncbi:MAG: hypothetical protein WC333_00335 [Dehalococcoidia bacterium]|jgi:hypothetical protein